MPVLLGWAAVMAVPREGGSGGGGGGGEEEEADDLSVMKGGSEA